MPQFVRPSQLNDSQFRALSIMRPDEVLCPNFDLTGIRAKNADIC